MTSDPGDAIARADLIIDGLLGIGGRGGLREPFARAAAAERARRDADATVVAVDLPSGIDADTGAVDGPAVRADVTVTFGAIKPGLLIDPGNMDMYVRMMNELKRAPDDNPTVGIILCTLKCSVGNYLS